MVCVAVTMAMTNTHHSGMFVFQLQLLVTAIVVGGYLFLRGFFRVFLFVVCLLCNRFIYCFCSLSLVLSSTCHIRYNIKLLLVPFLLIFLHTFLVFSTLLVSACVFGRATLIAIFFRVTAKWIITLILGRFARVSSQFRCCLISYFIYSVAIFASFIPVEKCKNILTQEHLKINEKINTRHEHNRKQMPKRRCIFCVLSHVVAMAKKKRCQNEIKRNRVCVS